VFEIPPSWRKAFACRITMEIFGFYYSYPCNHPGHQPTYHIGRNHFLVISSAFGLLSAQAGVHRRHQLKISREGQRSLGAADGHNLVFDWLAQHFQHAHPEFGELIQE